MPLQRRLPKRGFASLKKKYGAEVRLSEINKMTDEVIDLDSLKKAQVIAQFSKTAKVFLSGSIERKVTLKGITVSKGALAAITKAGGSVEA